MVLPDDFGLSPVQTLAHVNDGSRVARHSAFWKTWTEAVFEHTPRLVRRAPQESDPSDPTATHQFESCKFVRVGCALVLPPEGTPARAGIVTTHGYGPTPTLAEAADSWRPAAERGAAVLIVRVRGFPGSRLEDDDLSRHMAAAGTGIAGWITYGLEQPVSDLGLGTAWIFSYAVADTVNACRALKGFLESPEQRGPRRPGREGGPVPIFLHGESLGGALAVLAGAQLADQGVVARLAIGLPSMGDWSWRLSRGDAGVGVAGIGAEIRRFIVDHRSREGEIVANLRLFDAAIHARRVLAPTLCKLALRDDVVPAPAAAAVFNALGSAPGRKWRFVTPYGHFDGGLADLRRHALFERALGDFLDPARTPEEAMDAWEPLLASGERMPRPAPAAASATVQPEDAR